MFVTKKHEIIYFVNNFKSAYILPALLPETAGHAQALRESTGLTASHLPGVSSRQLRQVGGIQRAALAAP